MSKTTTVYFNYRGPRGTETVDELSSEGFASLREFHAEKRRLLREYNLAGMPVYESKRATKDWRESN